MKKILIIALLFVSFDTMAQGTKYTMNIGTGSVFITTAYSPVIQQVTTGTSATLADSTTMFVINPASLIASYTATLPAAPFNGKVVEFRFGGTLVSSPSSVNVVTNFTISANVGHTLVSTGSIGVVNTNDKITLIYYNSKWY